MVPKVCKIVMLTLAFGVFVTHAVPVFNTDNYFKINSNRIDNSDTSSEQTDNTVDPTAIFDSLSRKESSPENIRSLRTALMKSLMDPSVDPCDDFYQYACANWDKMFPIPDDNPSDSTVYTLLNNNIGTALRELLDFQATTSEADDENDATVKAKVYFSSCLDQNTRNKLGALPLVNLLNEFGSWPFLNTNWTGENFDWIDLVAKSAKIGVSVFIETGVDFDLKNSSNTAVHLMEGSLVLENINDYIEGKPSLMAYQNLIEDVLSFLNVSEDTAKKTAEDIVTFEIKLSNFTSNEHSNLSEVFGCLTLGEFKQLYPDIPWDKYLNIVYETRIEDNQTIVATVTSYFDSLTSLLADTDSHTIANYIAWRITFKFMNYLDSGFAESRYKLNQVLTGQQTAEPHWRQCVRETNDQFTMAVGAMFVRAYYDNDNKQDLEKLTTDIKEAFLESLKDVDWLDPETKRAAEIKANLTGISVGYPSVILDTEKLNKLYEDVHVRKDSHFQNAVNAHRNSLIREKKKLKQKFDKNFWAMSPAVVNAYFEQNQNRIIVPAAALQPPIYHRYLPKFLNYGGMGFFIGHELTHGFDGIGREFNFAGNMVEWWTDESIQEFDERTNCFTEQYSNYSIHGNPLEGYLSRGENIADNGGIRQAFYAYKKWLEKVANKDELLEENLPGFNMSNTQMFFLQFAQNWCGSIRPEAIVNTLSTDFHCPGKYRVIGSLSNFDEFAKEFNCPAGSPMNPNNKCKMW